MPDIFRKGKEVFSSAKIMFISFVLGALFWFADSIIDVIIFKEHSLLDQLFRPAAVEVWVRLFVFALFVIFGFYSNSIVRKLVRAEEELRKSHDSLEEKVKQRTAELEKEKSITEASLREKEVLLQEVHHRVKNNMQVISSLMKIQVSHIKDEETIKHFKESQNRIRSMSLIHEKLYMSRDLAHIDFRQYVRDLIKGLRRSFGARADRIRFTIDMDDVTLNTDTAIPCGLIVNELVSNSVKYAFPKDGENEIRVKVNKYDTDKIELAVSDNGIGIPVGMDIKKPRSMGLELVTLLAEQQLGGQIELDTARGTDFRIVFKELQHGNRE